MTVRIPTDYQKVILDSMVRRFKEEVLSGKTKSLIIEHIYEEVTDPKTWYKTEITVEEVTGLITKITIEYNND